MSLYCQYGYGNGNKIEKGLSSNLISGVILSPRIKTPEGVKEYIQQLHLNNNCNLYFDPQFYLCAALEVSEVNRGKLISYPFYEEDLTRKDFSNPANIRKYVKDVLAFEENLVVAALITPTIPVSDFNGREAQIAINMAYESIETNSQNKPIYISLCVNDSAFKNSEAVQDFLDSITMLDVNGFYIIIDHTIPEEASFGIEALANLMGFLYTLSTVARYHLIIGYSYLLSLLLAVCGNIDFAFGWYKNLKIFSKSNFERRSGGRRARPRYLSDKLLSAILINPDAESLNRIGLKDLYLSDSPYNDNLIKNTWNDEINCLHEWYVFNNLLNQIASFNETSEKCKFVFSLIGDAIQRYETINSKVPGVLIGSPTNLSQWNQAINLFRESIND